LTNQTLQNILKIFLKSLAQQKGIKRNLLIKRFIKNILYSEEQIQINLYYSEDFETFKNSILPSGVGTDMDKKEKGISVSISDLSACVHLPALWQAAAQAGNPQFVLLKMALLSKSLRTVPMVLPNSIHQAKERNLKK